jgi:1-acyl-sn-glycerol-3-phosphate acyltransferase
MNVPPEPAVAWDGFLARDAQAFQGFSPPVAAGFHRALEGLGARWHIRVDGLEHIPPGRALLVANHSFGYDVIFPVAAIARRLDRRVWMLGEHLWWKLPFVRRFVAAIGVVDGTQDNVDRLLAAGELVLVLPGGMREALKPQEMRYQLLWGQRYGFVRAAIRNQAPLVPLACVGTDNLFDVSIPHRRKLSFAFGEPIQPPAQDCASDEVVKRVRREVEGALHELIEAELGRRLGLVGC